MSGESICFSRLFAVSTAFTSNNGALLAAVSPSADDSDFSPVKTECCESAVMLRGGGGGGGGGRIPLPDADATTK